MNKRNIAAVAIMTLVALAAGWAVYAFLPGQRESVDADRRARQALESGEGRASLPAPRNDSSGRASARAPDPAAPVQNDNDVDGGAASTDAVDPETSPLRPARIAGHVYDMDGVGIAGALVRLKITSLPDAATAHYSAATGRDGAYVIADVEHFGEAVLIAYAPGFTPFEYENHYGAPNILKIEEGGQYASIDFALSAAMLQLRGRVLTPRRAGVSDARVAVVKQGYRQSMEDKYWVLSGEDGAFEIDLPSDESCVVVAYKEGFAPGYLGAAIPSSGAVEIILGGGGAIVGVIKDAKGNAAQGMKVVVTPESLEGDGNHWRTPKAVTAVSQEDGNYAARGLSEEFTYTVQVPYPMDQRPEAPSSVRTLSEFIKLKEGVVCDYTRGRLDPVAAITPVVMAEVNNVFVRADQETRVDLSLEDADGGPAVIHGRIFDTATAEPSSPFYIFALNSDNFDQHEIVSMAITQEDGSYRMLCQGLAGPTSISVRLNYARNLGANDGDAVMGELVLSPGDVKEVNYSLSASVTAPVRVVDSSGKAIQGAMVDGIITDADGRLIVYGLEPNLSQRLGAWWDGAGTVRMRLLGISEFFTGKPGETIPEVVIACPELGWIVGRLILPENMVENPTGDYVRCWVDYPDLGRQFLDSYILPDGLLYTFMVWPGLCRVEFILSPENEEDADWYEYAVTIEDVLVVSGQETDVGIIAPEYQSLESL